MDKSLLQVVHEETHDDLRLNAMISRFGGLYVSVFNTETFETLHSCDNILDARRWVRNMGVAS
jgi:hypothetical protein